MGPVSDKNRKSWIHVLILCIIYMFSSCVLYSPDMSCRQCARSPPHIPCCPLMSQFMFGGRLVGDGGWWGTNWLLTNPTSYWFPIGTVCLAASYYANIANISEHTRPICPHCCIFDTKYVVRPYLEGFSASQLKTYDPSSPLSSPRCCLFPSLRQPSFISGGKACLAFQEPLGETFCE